MYKGVVHVCSLVVCWISPIAFDWSSYLQPTNHERDNCEHKQTQPLGVREGRYKDGIGPRDIRLRLETGKTVGLQKNLFDSLPVQDVNTPPHHPRPTPHNLHIRGASSRGRSKESLEFSLLYARDMFAPPHNTLSRVHNPRNRLHAKVLSQELSCLNRRAHNFARRSEVETISPTTHSHYILNS